MMPKRLAVPVTQKKAETRRCGGCTFTKVLVPFTDNSGYFLKTWETTDDRGQRIQIIPREDNPWHGPWIVVAHSRNEDFILFQKAFHEEQGENNAFLFAALFVKGQDY